MSNNKPINVEAQRVQRVINDTKQKLHILSLLNEEFFNEVRKKDEPDIVNHFGPQVGSLVWKHAQLEEKFTNVCLENGVKMIPLTDEFIPEEAYGTAIELRETTSKLIRCFSSQENQLRLKQFETKSQEFAAFQEAFEQLDKLYSFKLCTPLEEVNAIKNTLKLTQSKVQKLQETRDTKKDSYDKYIEECSKSKEMREVNIKTLREQITSVSSHSDTLINEALEDGSKDEESLNQSHGVTYDKLVKEQKKLKSDLDKMLKSNNGTEQEIRKTYGKVMQDYHNNMTQYDTDIAATVLENQKYQGEYEDTLADLKQINEEYNMRLEERRKRDEIAAIMAKKNEEQNAKMEKLSRAVEWVQAHWRGLLARKEMDKARKGKKKKKKKK